MRCTNSSTIASHANSYAAAGLNRGCKPAMVDTGVGSPISLDTVLTPSEIRQLLKLLSVH
ncbi:MAG: hypothetical protein HQL53_13895 [Magnetococcales bacterium]|nr:hypothetical protein [Magnetococcales bacterium]